MPEFENRPPYETFKHPTCRGTMRLGNNYGHCEKCTWEAVQLGTKTAKDISASTDKPWPPEFPIQTPAPYPSESNFISEVAAIKLKEQIKALDVKTARWAVILQDIIDCAQTDPQALVAFNSPWLQRLVHEIYYHNHPEVEEDYEAMKSRTIFQQLCREQKLNWRKRHD